MLVTLLGMVAAAVSRLGSSPLANWDFCLLTCSSCILPCELLPLPLVPDMV